MERINKCNFIELNLSKGALIYLGEHHATSSPAHAICGGIVISHPIWPDVHGSGVGCDESQLETFGYSLSLMSDL